MGLATRRGKSSRTNRIHMAGEIFEKYYDPDDRENYWADTEPKSTKNLHAAIMQGITTKDELDIIESSLKIWHDGDVGPEIFEER